jgi:capsular polysaccharide export protein
MRPEAMTFTLENLQTPLLEPSLFRSDIESLLLESHFPADLLLRAATFRRGLVMAGLKRFTSSEVIWRRPVSHDRVILVVGQSENDSSLKQGAHNIHCNRVLLKVVCQAHADAYIVYKPHPEVWAHMQAQGLGTQDLLLWCDECVGDVPLAELLPKVNEVHVMSSLAGFEALMRGKKVSCYGESFYAGWGLTNDVVPLPARGRRLSLDELVAAAMFCYPSYMRRLAQRVGQDHNSLADLGAIRHQLLQLSATM